MPKLADRFAALRTAGTSPEFSGHAEDELRIPQPGSPQWLFLKPDA